MCKFCSARIPQLCIPSKWSTNKECLNRLIYTLQFNILPLARLHLMEDRIGPAAVLPNVFELFYTGRLHHKNPYSVQFSSPYKMITHIQTMCKALCRQPSLSSSSSSFLSRVIFSSHYTIIRDIWPEQKEFPYVEGSFRYCHSSPEYEYVLMSLTCQHLMNTTFRCCYT